LLDVIALGRVTPGAARAGYGGILERTSEGWQLHEADGIRNIELNQNTFVPARTAEQRSGYVVRVAQQETSPARALIAAVLIWVLGGALLLRTFRHVHGNALGLRATALGLLFTLVFIRGTLAFRVWLERPYRARAPATFLALLILLPALIAAYHTWQERGAEGRKAARHFAPIGGYVLIALLIALAVVVPVWRGTLIIGALAPLAMGTAGLWLLQRLLMSPSGGAPAVLSPSPRSRSPRQGGTATVSFTSRLQCSPSSGSCWLS
jgi:hypothetical protein